MTANSIATVYYYSGRLHESEKLLLMVEDLAPVNIPVGFEAKRCRALVHHRLGVRPQAEIIQLQLDALHGFKDLLGPNHPSSLLAAIGLAMSLSEYPGRESEGKSLAQAVVDAYKTSLEPLGSTTWLAITSLAASHLALDEFDSCEQFSQAVVDYYCYIGVEISMACLHVKQILAVLRLQQKRYNEAATLARESLDGLESLFGPNDFTTGTARAVYGFSLTLSGSTDKARFVLEQALADISVISEPSSRPILMVQVFTAMLYLVTGSLTHGIQLLKELFLKYPEVCSPKSKEMTTVYSTLLRV